MKTLRTKVKAPTTKNDAPAPMRELLPRSITNVTRITQIEEKIN